MVIRQMVTRFGADFSGLTKALKKANASVRVTNINFLSATHSADKMSVAYNEAARSTERAANRMAKSTQKSSGVMRSAFSGLDGLMRKVFAVAGTAALVKFGKDSIEVASSMTEVQNVVNQAFGSMAASAEEFASKSYLFNMTALQAKKTASTYMAMGKAVGLASDQAADMAINIAALTGDMSSFFDISQDTVDVAMKAVWTGETESIKKFGVVLTQANLEEYALQRGIKKTWKEMTQAEKTTLRYAYVMDRLAFAQGDALRTSGSWANRVRRISREFLDLKSVVGQGLINVFYNLLEPIEKAIKRLAYFGELFRQVTVNLFGEHNDPSGGAGYTEIFEEGAAAADGMTEAVGDLGDAIKKALLPIDQIHKLGDVNGSGSSSGGMGNDFLGLLGGTGYAQELMEKNPAKNLLSEEDVAEIERKAGLISGIIGDLTGFVSGKLGELKTRLGENLGVDIEDASAREVLDGLVQYSGEKVSEILGLFGIEVDFSNVSFEGIKQKIEDFKKYLEENHANIEHALFLAGASTVGVFAVLVREAIDVFSPLLPGIKDIVDGVTKVIYGIVEFINGIFSGDLDLAIDGIKDIFHGIVDFVWGIVEEIAGAFLGFLELINPASWMSNIGEFAGKALKIKGVEGSDELIEGWKGVRKNMTVNGAVEEAFGGWNNVDFTPQEKPKMSFLEWLHDLTGLASGGVVYSDSVVRVGEYAGANMNPEVIAPQSIMRETVEESNMGVIDALYAMTNRVCKAIEDNRAVVSVGGKQLADDVTRQQNDRAKITGKPILAV